MNLKVESNSSVNHYSIQIETGIFAHSNHSGPVTDSLKTLAVTKPEHFIYDRYAANEIRAYADEKVKERVTKQGACS